MKLTREHILTIILTILIGVAILVTLLCLSSCAGSFREDQDYMWAGIQKEYDCPDREQPEVKINYLGDKTGIYHVNSNTIYLSGYFYDVMQSEMIKACTWPKYNEYLTDRYTGEQITVGR